MDGMETRLGWEWSKEHTVRAKQKVGGILSLAPLDPVDLLLNLERL